METEVVVHPLMQSVSWLIGKWEAKGASGKFPNKNDFNYDEIIEFQACGDKPIFLFKATSFIANTNSTMHLETGFLRARKDNEYSLMLAHNFGLTTIEEGLFDGEVLTLKTSNLARMTGSDPNVTKTERKFKKLEDGKIGQQFAMSTREVEEITDHLSAVYIKLIPL